MTPEPDATTVIAELRGELAAVRLENKMLRLKLDALSRRMFGKSSEKLDAEQRQLLLDGIEELTLAEESARQTRPGRQPAAVEATRERKPRIPDASARQRSVHRPRGAQGLP